MAKGLLVDDATMLEIIRDRVAQPDAQRGFILDGFPRTQPQAEAPTTLMGQLGTPIDAVVLFDVGAEELVRRISGRRTCSLCNKVFNVYSAPASSPATDCLPDSTEHQLFQRKDDEEATVTERLRVYEENTRPVLSYYSDAGLLRTVKAEGSLEEITRRLLAALDGAAPAKPSAPAKPARAATRRKPSATRRPAAAAKKTRTKSVARKTARSARKGAKATRKTVKPARKTAKSGRKTARSARKTAARPAKSGRRVMRKRGGTARAGAAVRKVARQGRARRRSKRG
jgi:adenylate kinase